MISKGFPQSGYPYMLFYDRAVPASEMSNIYLDNG